jgi:DNA-binding XRE family transcriptional regulator
VEVLEIFPSMRITKEELLTWAAEHIQYLRKSYMFASKIAEDKISQEKFADRAGVEWRTIYNIENDHQEPGLWTLHKIVTAADSNLAEFCSQLVTRMELASIQRKSKDEQEWIQVLIRGLANPTTRKIVQHAAEHVADVLKYVEAQ